MNRRLTTIFSMSIVLALNVLAESRESYRQAGLATAQGDSGAALAITHGPYLQLPTGTSMTIVWHTNKKCVSKVEYGTDERLGLTATSSQNGLIDNDRTSHAIRLSGLKPGVTYKYRVVSREFGGYQKQHIVTFGETVASPACQFTTLDPGKEGFSFSMVSDIHERAADLDSMLGQKYFQDVDFVVYNGDMLNDFMQLDQVFNGFLDVTVGRYAKEKPFLFVRGNHEVRGRFARALPDFFPTVDGRAYYSFDHGGVHFVVLDSGEDKEDSHEYYNGLVDFQNYRREQAEWLKADLGSDACRKAAFRIVFSHIPPRGAEGFAIQDVRRNFEDLANKAGVDLWLSGHTHRFQLVAAAQDQNTYPLMIGATDTITRVEVSRDRLKLTAIRMNGQELLPPVQFERRRGNRQPAP
jgi:predicted phosphodiesterase